MEISLKRSIIGFKDGVGMSEGTEWKRNRDPLSKRLLRPKFLAGYFPKLSVIAKNAVTDVQWSSLISKSGFARENLLISELANRAILLIEQYCY